MKTYTLYWRDARTADRAQQREFTSWEAARDWAEANISPEVNGSTVPNVKAFSSEHHDIDGVYWLGNRYAQIVSPI